MKAEHKSKVNPLFNVIELGFFTTHQQFIK